MAHFKNASKIIILICETKSVTHSLGQWFSTGVSRHTRVPYDGVRGSAIYHFLSISRDAAKYWYGGPRVPRGKKGWKPLLNDFKSLLYSFISGSKSLFLSSRHIDSSFLLWSVFGTWELEGNKGKGRSINDVTHILIFMTRFLCRASVYKGWRTDVI